MEQRDPSIGSTRLGYRDGELCLGPVPIREIAAGHGTPLFLFSQADLQASFAAIAGGLAGMGGPTAIRYAAKTNPEAALLAILAGCGGEVLVSHPAEASLALASGFPAARVAYQRPLLEEAEIRGLLAQGIDRLHALRMEDLDRLERAAAAAGRRVRVTLRVRGVSAGRSGSPLAVLGARLGLSREAAVRAAARIAGSARLSLEGLHAYIGTQRESPRGHCRLLEVLVGLAAEIRAVCGLALEEITVGGGLPSPDLVRLTPGRLWGRLRGEGGPGSDPRPIGEYVGRMATAYRAAATGRLDPMPRLVVEPGRALVGAAGCLVTRVGALQGRWAFLDASRHYLPESPLLFRRRVLPVRAAPAGHPHRRYHLSGATLDTLDVLDLWRRLPALRVGDLLVLGAAGAYSLGRASRYAGLLPAAYLLGVDGRLRLMRRAETLADLTGPMRPGGAP